MGRPSETAATQLAPPPSAIQSFLDTHPVAADSPHAPQFHHLALRICHNLRFQHGWTNLRIHHNSASSSDRKALPRPMISGVPLQRLYIHPDEQIELLQHQKDIGQSGMPKLEREREWVLPSHLHEKWTLRRFGDVFDAIPAVPEDQYGEVLFDSDDGVADVASENKWRLSQPKRLLLATLDDDSTVVYYIVHDGVVKPRQN